MAYLLPDRIRETSPFAVTGLDYLGPLYYDEKSESRKSYILLFTCAVTREMKKGFNVLDHSLNSEECRHYFSEKRITWKTNAPLGAWWSGFWERLVRSVKSSVKRIMGKAALNYWDLETVVIEVEAIINSSPLTYQDD
ncbi:hypothetical protein AVEN_68495-1 [Araneus ventricosus]|uniref:Integrase catalytic domain-containing protein n=1 Tax=Araneus ventricosus TaxID=182803 RepID=A0A4Y2I710_ARAVE|nr:hypothetical protein AVEN_68495-1 [Araneus ventricosus]